MDLAVDAPPVARPSATRRPVRRPVVWAGIVVVAFVVTRALPVVLTTQPQLYGPQLSDPAGDLGRYAAWAGAMVRDGRAPYTDFDVEYPPGVLPFVIMPALVGDTEFSTAAFIALLVVVDLAGLAALVVVVRRGGSPAGAVLWLALPGLLGVVLYGRLDLVCAVALLLALERTHARRFAAAGLWLGLGTAAKLVPGLALPLLLLAAPRGRMRLLAGALTGALAAWLPHAAAGREIVHDVIGYHAARGVHLESLWGSVLNLQRLTGRPVALLFERGAFGITGPTALLMVRASTVLDVVIVAGVSVIAAVRWHRRGYRARSELPLAATTMLALLLGTARVFSPQFVVWLLAASAMALAVTPVLWRWVAPTLALVVVLTVLEYPLGFDLLREGARWPAVVLVCRNATVLGLGVALLARWVTASRCSPAGSRVRGQRVAR